MRPRDAGPRRDHRHGRTVGLDGEAGAGRGIDVHVVLGQAGTADLLVVDVLAHVVHRAVAVAEVVRIAFARDRAAVITQGDGGLLQGQVELGGVLQVDVAGTDVGSGVIHHGHHAGAGLRVVHVVTAGRLGRQQQECGREERRSVQHALHTLWVF